MNRNGIIGEASDCKICDGSTTDPDNDGANEDIVYVDAGLGNDTSGTGSSIQPYKTISKALSVINGPSIGQEDIICLAGTFVENINLTTSGKSTTANVNSISRATNPLIISGWDKNKNGFYAPADPDETAVIKANSSMQWFIDNTVNQASFIEMAHLLIDGTDMALSGDSGFFNGQANDASKNWYFHDLEFEKVNYQDVFSNTSGLIVSAGNVQNMELDFLKATNLGGKSFGFNSSIANGSNIRVENTTTDMASLLGDNVWDPVIVKGIDNFIYKDNLLDGNVPSTGVTYMGGNHHCRVHEECCDI